MILDILVNAEHDSDIFDTEEHDSGYPTALNLTLNILDNVEHDSVYPRQC